MSLIRDIEVWEASDSDLCLFTYDNTHIGSPYLAKAFIHEVAPKESLADYNFLTTA